MKSPVLIPNDAEAVRQLFLEFTGSTYSKATLLRRLSLLTKTEQIKFTRLFNNIVKTAEKMDNMLAERAEKAKDRWS